MLVLLKKCNSIRLPRGWLGGEGRGGEGRGGEGR